MISSPNNNIKNHSFIWKLEPFKCLYKFANNKINKQTKQKKKERKDLLYKAGV